MVGVSASALSLPRPAQASLTLRLAGSLRLPRRPLSRGSAPTSHPTEPLASFRTYRQLSGWNPPPLVIRAVRAHCQQRNITLSDDHYCGAFSATETLSSVRGRGAAGKYPSHSSDIALVGCRPRDE